MPKLIFLVLIAFFFSQVHSHLFKELKNRIYSCNTIACSQSLNVCMHCYGERQCRQCITNYNQECSTCADEIFDKNNLQLIGGSQYKECDTTNPFDAKICHVFCRGQLIQTGVCTRVQNMAVCYCTANPSPTTISSLVTTTTEASTTSQSSSICPIVANFDGIMSSFVANHGDICYTVLKRIDIESSNGTELILNDQSFCAIEYNVFDGLNNLLKLHLSNNRLNFLCPGVFADLVGLQTLDLSSNHIKYIHNGVFDGLVNLKFLDLKHNQISRINANNFNGLGINLLQRFSIDLRFNQIETIEEFAFNNTHSDHLCLEYNKISILPKDAFNGLSGRHLRLTLNNMTDLDINSFDSIGFVYQSNISHVKKYGIEISLGNSISDVKLNQIRSRYSQYDFDQYISSYNGPDWRNCV